MFRTKIIAIMALALFTFAIPITGIQADEPTVLGTVTFDDDAGSNDAVTISISGVSGGTYVASLVSSDGATSQQIGEVTVVTPVLQGKQQTTGDLDLRFDSNSPGYDGSNLMESYSRFQLTDGSITYSASSSGVLTAELVTLTSHLNDLKSLVTMLIIDLDTASKESDISTLKAGVSSAVGHLSKIGPLAEGILASGNAANAIDSTVSTENLESNVSNITNWTSVMIEDATYINETSNIKVARVFLGSSSGGMIAYANALLNGMSDTTQYNDDGDLISIAGNGGTEQAIDSAQVMQNLNVILGELPAPEIEDNPVDIALVTESDESNRSALGLGLPSVGEKSLALLMQLLTITGILLLGTGTLMIFRSKQS
jgi:hypothetical protein